MATPGRRYPMSTMTTPRGAPMPRGELSPRNRQKARALGLTSATGLVIGSIIGTGVFAMPAVMAGAGTSSLLVLAVIAIGATLLAIMFGQLTRRVPLDPGLGGQCRHRRGLGVLRGCALRHPPVRARELGHRTHRPVGAGRG